MIPTLIVDPEAERHSLYQKVFGNSFSLSFTDNAENGFSLFCEKHPLIIVVIAELPDQTGIYLCRRIRAEGGSSHPFKILLAGKDLDDEILGRDTAEQMGADDLIMVPLAEAKLRAKIRDLVAELAGKGDSGKKSEPAEVKAPAKAQAPAAAKAAEVDTIEADETPLPVPKEVGSLSESDLKMLGVNLLNRIIRLNAELDHTDYYALLGIEHDTHSAKIRKAYYQLTKSFHPDRFALLENKKLFSLISTIFKRMNEAYQVLKDQEKRKEYDDQLADGGEERLITKERTRTGPRQDADQISNPQAKKFYTYAQSAIDANNLSSAKMNISLAISMAPNDPVIKSKMEEIEELLGDS